LVINLRYSRLLDAIPCRNNPLNENLF